jgi:hypothetical protein
MTPQEKAQQLLHEYRMLFMDEGEDYGEEILVSVLSKQCALIAVDEILNNFGSRVGDKTHYCNYLTIQYYQEVKQEIEKL